MKQNSFKLLKKLYIVFLMAVCVLTSNYLSLSEVRADELGGSHKGTISMVIATDGGKNPIEGAEFAVYRVADCYVDETVLRYTLTKEFMNSGIDLTKIKDTETAKLAAEFAKKSQIGHLSGKTDKEGKIAFKNLEIGLYLVVQTNEIAQTTEVLPFFVAVGQLKDGRFIYDVDATPKVSLKIYYDLKVQKIWNDDGTNRPSEIKVALKKNGQTVKTIVLSKKNNWTYTWSDLAKADIWSVEEIEIPKGYVATYRKDGVTFIIENTPGLAKTGQDKWKVSVLACVGMAFLIAGITIKLRKDEK